MIVRALHRTAVGEHITAGIDLALAGHHTNRVFCGNILQHRAQRQQVGGGGVDQLAVITAHILIERCLELAAQLTPQELHECIRKVMSHE